MGLGRINTTTLVISVGNVLRLKKKIIDCVQEGNCNEIVVNCKLYINDLDWEKMLVNGTIESAMLKISDLNGTYNL